MHSQLQHFQYGIGDQSGANESSTAVLRNTSTIIGAWPGVEWKLEIYPDNLLWRYSNVNQVRLRFHCCAVWQPRRPGRPCNLSRLFQPQIYRSNGEKILLPEGIYTVICSMGPEYLTQTKRFRVSAAGPNRASFAMPRWINPAKYGWYSGDHHVHAAGCSHYQNPTEGVRPEDMVRQIKGEKLNVGAVLTWGFCYYYQKQFFTGKDNPLPAPDRLMHYDLEVSGFPSSHAGHLVLLMNRI